jgi:uncharacterized membrane protein YhaH (DUF805 family)
VSVTGRIFISYRRGDSQGAAGRLFDRLLAHFERDQLFIDVDAIEPGVDFAKLLEEQVANCGAFIAVIGPGWLDAKSSSGGRRLDDPNDYVRIEIEAALKRDIRVIPVLVDGASMPPPSALPASLEALSRRNAMELAHHRFAADCDVLAQTIRRALGVPEPAKATEPVTALPAAPPPPDGKMSWNEIVFSFKGRLSRQQFLIAVLLFVLGAMALAIALFALIDLSFETADEQTREATKKLRELLEQRLVSLIQIVLWWPVWAMILKRLHDFGQGWQLLLVFIGVDVAMVVLDLLGYDSLSTQLLLLYLGVTFMLGVVKGVEGPNQYGPDPRMAAGPRPKGQSPS